MIGIYKITNKLNNKVYIGQSIDIYHRWRQHKNSYKYNYKKSKNKNHLYNAMLKYGVENFIFEIIEECKKEELNDREIYWIRHYDSANPNKGYNLTDGGDNISDCLKVEIHQYDLQGNFIKTYPSIIDASKETGINKSAISACASENITNIKRAGNFFWSKNKQNHISLPINLREVRKIYQFDLSGNLINTYNSMSEAAKKTNINVSLICSNCNNPNKVKSCKGYIFSKENKKPEYINNQGNNRKNVYIFDKNKKLLKKFDSIKEASLKLTTDESTIRRHIKNKKQFNNFYFSLQEVFE